MSQFVTLLHRIVAILFFACLCAVALRWGGALPARPALLWAEPALVLLALVTLVSSMSRRLPLQNVLLGCAMIGGIAGLAVALGSATGMPFGPIRFTGHSWIVLPLLWIVFVLSSRAAARLALARWRASRNYGFVLIGATTVLVLLLDIAFEPVAIADKRLWHWDEVALGLSLAGTPWTNFLGWGVTTLVILAFVTPVLINKRPGAQPPDHYSAAVWAGLQVLLMVGAIAGSRHYLAMLGAVQVCAVALLTFTKKPDRAGAKRV